MNRSFLSLLQPFVLAALLVGSGVALAANTPCSGSKGGIAGCDGETFLCNDGSISASKKNCSAMLGVRDAASLARPQQRLQSAEGCQCGSGSYCTGPRGGVYCLTPGGSKSYKRR
ncbi:hypothetical protein [Pseudomonas asplenii]|uniref:YdcA family protein n=1 Tax=Pseudomonas asplenii TaxID=53407 RepID=UPI00036E49B5